jgi:hypothetical protein
VPTFSTREYQGWTHCIAVAHDGIELVVTTDVGPRVISLAAAGGRNIFKEFPNELGRTSGDEFLLFGGHRLWHAPEAYPRSYSPDFDPVEFRIVGDVLHLQQAVEPATGIAKSIELQPMPGGFFRLRHRLANHNLWPVQLSPWCLTMLASGARAFVPQEEFRPHPQCLDPARTLTLWHYSRMNDPRVRWGQQFIQLTEDSRVDQKMKFGVRNSRGWAGCWIDGILFIKTFSYRADAIYPDLGSNCELFTMPGFLELESLGPITSLAPGESLIHDEIWHLWRVPELPSDDEDLASALQPYVDRLVMPA